MTTTVGSAKPEVLASRNDAREIVGAQIVSFSRPDPSDFRFQEPSDERVGEANNDNRAHFGKKHGKKFSSLERFLPVTTLKT